MSDPESIETCGLRCFGAISASLSHELKNALAIINEHAGLLEDMMLMAGAGRALDPDRLKLLAGNVMKQVQRADTMIKHMNQFAHSVDVTVACSDLEDALTLAIALNSRTAVMKGGALVLEPSATPVRITTCPFWVQTLIWRSLNELLERTGADRQLHLSARKTSDGAAIIFSPVDHVLTNIHIPDVLNHLKATQALDIQTRELWIVLPADINANRADGLFRSCLH